MLAVTGTGGVFTLTVGGRTSQALPYNIPELALEVEISRLLEDPFAVVELRTSSPAVPASPSRWSQVNKTVEVSGCGGCGCRLCLSRGCVSSCA